MNVIKLYRNYGTSGKFYGYLHLDINTEFDSVRLYFNCDTYKEFVEVLQKAGSRVIDDGEKGVEIEYRN